VKIRHFFYSYLLNVKTRQPHFKKKSLDINNLPNMYKLSTYFLKRQPRTTHEPEDDAIQLILAQEGSDPVS